MSGILIGRIRSKDSINLKMWKCVNLKMKIQDLRRTLAPMVMASFDGGVRQQRYNGQRD